MSKYNVEKFRNVTVAMNACYDHDGKLSKKATAKLAKFYYDRGVKNLYVCGSTGEGFLLDMDERRQTVEAVMDEVGGKMTVIVHVGCADTPHSIELAKHAEKCGADGISAVPCVYYRPDEESIFTHWTKITEAADLPFFIYNIPQLTGYALSMPLFNRVIKNERIAGVKNSSEAVHDILRFKQAGGKDFIVFSGCDEQYLAGRIMGADAGIGGTYGTMPELYLKLEELIRKEEFEKAQKLQDVITPLIYRLCDFPSMYGASKTIIKMDGADIGEPRLPFLPVSEDDEKLRALYRDIHSAIDEAKKL